MVDGEAIERRLREIDRRIASARRIRDAGRDAFLKDEDLQGLAERHLQIAIQTAIDIAVHILAEDSAQTPEDYASSFRLLGELDVIRGDLATQLALAAGLRNVLVHAYLEVDPKRLWLGLERMSDLEEFAVAVRRYLAK